jgi:lysophospholipase L1-like esterase
LSGPVPPGSTCNWNFDDGTIPPQQVSVPCTDEVRVRLRYGKPTIASAGIVQPDQSVDSVTTEIRVRDLLIAGLGDSVASGEGNPDRPVGLSDDGYCFRRFLGSSASEYFRPSRAGFQGLKACDDTPGGPGRDVVTAWARAGARWMSPACHRSLYSYQARSALAVAIENPQIAVTFVPLACTGASIDSGLLGSQRASDCPMSGTCATSVPGQIAQLQDMLNAAKKQNPERGIDLILLTIGANDIKFSGLVADVIIQSGVERSLFSQGGMLTGLPDAQKLLQSDLPAGFAKLRNALKPLVGGNLGRVVYVAYGHPALQNGETCPGGRDGLDVHPAFNADATRLKNVSDFVSDKFLPRLKQLARCEGGTVCRDPSVERMTFVDAHQPAFAQRGFCARSPQDPVFDRECFSDKGESFDSDPVSAATQPLICDRRPSEFKPYAPRARWIRTANDSYFTAMTFPQGMPTVLQPANLHDATWGAMSAVYGGAIHPSAEGHAAMADAALPAMRQVLGLSAPAPIEAEPLPPLTPASR